MPTYETKVGMKPIYTRFGSLHRSYQDRNCHVSTSELGAEGPLGERTYALVLCSKKMLIPDPEVWTQNRMIIVLSLLV